MPGIGIGIAPHEILQTMSVGPPPFRFDLSAQTFAAYMAKRAGQGPFAAAPIVQGSWDGAAVPDVLTFPRGNLIGNQTQFEYANFDPYQGSVVFWITPEWDGNDGVLHWIYGSDNDPINIYKRADNLLIIRYEITIIVSTNIAAWTTGTTYCVIARWDSLNTLDGTNYGCISINDVHNFDSTSSWTAVAPPATQYIGSYGGVSNAGDSILEGLTIYRRPLYDGTYGVRPMNGNQHSDDEINAIYNAGAGRDPTLVTGSEDVCFCLPTNSTEEILATGTGEAWSWPWGDNLLDVWGAWDGGLPGTDRAVEFDAVDTVINCGSDVDIDDIADAEFTAEAWIRADSFGESGFGNIIAKVDNAATTVGWLFQLFTGYGLFGHVICATTPAQSRVAFTPDGKWHHITMYFNDAGDRKIYIAIDGVWQTYSVQTTGVGAIQADAAEDLTIGAYQDTSRNFDGGIAWAAISNNDRYSHGTDFVPPRAFPADDANYLASWAMDEGTGVAIANTGNQGGGGSGAANRDGTLANGSWSSIWEQDATPVIPQSVECDGALTNIIVSDAVNIQDLQDADFTLDIAFRANGYGEGDVGVLISKSVGATGWLVSYSLGNLNFRVNAGTDSVATITGFVPDKRWHTVQCTFSDAGDRKARIYLDGILQDTGDAAVGVIDSDVGNDVGIGCRPSGAASWDGAIGWVRLSDNLRSATTVTAYVPVGRTNPPANDGNAHLLINMTDGAGVTATDTSGNGYDGAITDGVWNNTPDMEIDEPGAAIYGPKGYNLGVDAADEGMYIEQVVVAETDYVVFPVISIGESGRARPVIRIYDVSNAADVVSFKGPELHGVDAGAGNAAVLTVATARFIADELIGGTVYNIDDGSSAPITDNTETTVIGTLSGGTDDDWDIGDEYVIRFPYGYCERPWMESFCFQTPVGCTLLRVFIENESVDGVMQVHQVQVMPSILTNGSLEVGAGDPWIPTGWSNVTMDAGDTEQEVTVVHSGSSSLQMNAGALNNESIRASPTLASGKYADTGFWGLGSGAEGVTLKPENGQWAYQYQSSGAIGEQEIAAAWTHIPFVTRRTSTSANTWFLHGDDAGPLYADDFYIIALDDVSITVTPASEANSLKAGGIRVDGRDTSDQPVANVRFNAGWIWCNARPRHETGQATDFGQGIEFILDCYEDANNYIRVWRTNNTVNLEYNASGAGLVTAAWNSTGLWNEDVDVEIWVQYGAFGAWLIIDGVNRVTLAGPVVFATDFTLPINWGHRQDGAMQFDGVIS